MKLEIIKYGHPVLRKKGARIDKVTPEIQKLVADMIDTMDAGSGIGLAAQQVGQALQLMVIDVRDAKDRPSTLTVKGRPTDVGGFMPLALINPEVKAVGSVVEGPEGCLSFPEMYSDIPRPESIEVAAVNEKGERLEFQCGGLLARVIQHELDHLNGILFIDRMSVRDRLELKEQLEELQSETKACLAKKK
jgi:peptide deformylase